MQLKSLATALVAGAALLAPAVAIDVDVFAAGDTDCGTALNTLGTFQLSDGACDIVPGSTTSWWSITCDGSDWTFTTHSDALCANAASSTDTGSDATCTNAPNAGIRLQVDCAAASAVSPQNSILNNAVEAGLSTLATVVSGDDYTAVATPLNSAGTLTVFAPTDAAFTAATFVNTSDVPATSATLFYHVLGSRVASGDLQPLQFVETLATDQDYVNVGTGVGQNLKVASDGGVTLTFGLNSATVTTADVASSNGIVHVVNAVLELPPLTSTTATAAGLTELVTALSDNSLVSAVDDTAQLTIFAPTNDAFDNAIFPENATMDDITAVLEQHVVPGAVAFSNGLTDGQEVTTLEGNTLVISVGSDGSVSVNGSNVVIADVIVQNGVVHVIDKVIGLEVSPAFATAASPALLLVAVLLAFFGSA